MSVSRRIACLLLVLIATVAPLAAAAEPPAKYVIHISVDGLNPTHLNELLKAGEVPTFARLQAEGAWTHNARTDFDYTNTLPNHTCMVTCRPVMDKEAEPSAISGHMWRHNSDPEDRTLHTERRDYIKSAFDVAHDHGLRTGMFVSKSKFVLYDLSYNERTGAPDTDGEDNGRDKIDVYYQSSLTPIMTKEFLKAMDEQPIHYCFVHFRDTDTAGHATGWGSPAYNNALKQVDRQLGRILELVTTDERFKDQTAIVLSADHGGTGKNHGVNSNPLNYTIPFYVWGAGVAKGKDLYALNEQTRSDPKSTRQDYVGANRQPIRNGDGGNLALQLLGLGPIPGSLINAAQDLAAH